MWAAPAIHSMAAGASTGSSPCQAGQTFCFGAPGCAGCGSVTLVNGTCAKPCTGLSCTTGACIGDASGAIAYCGAPVFAGSCNTDGDCGPGTFCSSTGFGIACIPATC